MCCPKTRLPCQQHLYASQMPHRGITIHNILCWNGISYEQRCCHCSCCKKLIKSLLPPVPQEEWNRNSDPTCISSLSTTCSRRKVRCMQMLTSQNSPSLPHPLVSTRCSSLVHHASKPFFLSWWEREAILPVSEILSARNMLIKMELLYSSSRVITLPH